MKIVDKMRSYILEDEFTVTVLKNQVDIVNYKSIGHFDMDKIIVYHEDGELVIRGSKLVVSRLLHDEVLITGVIKSLELR